MQKNVPILDGSAASIDQSLESKGLVWARHPDSDSCGVDIWTPVNPVRALLEGREIRLPKEANRA